MTETRGQVKYREIGGGDVPSSLRVNETNASQLTDIMQTRCDSSSAHSYEVESRKLTKCQITKQENDDFINQNRSNKQNEKLNKPCKNGFCYCFTSDSDEFRLSANSSERHKKLKRSEHVAQTSNKTHKSKPREPVKPVNKPEKINKTPDSKNCFQAISKLEKNCVYNSDAPFVHIVQEIRENCFISEVTVNKAKMGLSNVAKNVRPVYTDKEVLAAFNRRRSCPAKTTRDQSTSISEDLTKSTLQTSSKTTETTKDDSRSTKKTTSSSADHTKSSLETSSKSSGKKGGRLLQKRLSNTNPEKGFRQLNSNTPPRKPPRQINYNNNSGSEAVTYSTSASVREAEKLLDEFIKSHGKNVPVYTEKNTKNTRKSYPMEKKKKNENKLIRSQRVYPTPSCPSLSEIESVLHEWKEEKTNTNEESNIGWNQQSIREMLNYDKNSKSNEFKTFQSHAEPQKIGWTVSPKLNIDTVDSPDTRRRNENEDFHNLAINLESKSTPKKSEINSNELKSPSSKFNIKEQVSKVVSSSQLDKKDSPKLSNSFSSNKSKLSFRKKAKDNTKQFLSSSKKTLKKLVCKDGKKKQQKQKEPLTTRTTSSQTSVADLVSTSKIRLKSDSNSNRRSLQSPPGSYASKESKTKSSHQNSQEEFNFERKIQSPKTTRCFQKQLNFAALKNNRSAEQRLNNALLHHHSYKSFTGGIDRDITMNKMSDILGSIKAKLEASDELAIRTFRDVERREQSYVDSTSEPYARIISARAEIHKTVATETELDYDPLYSEIEEEGYVVTTKPSIQNLTDISHFIASNDPNAIYAQVNKSMKAQKSLQSSYSNHIEEHSPPNYRYESKSDISRQSENFHDNFHSYGYEEKPTILINSSNEMKNASGNEINVPLASVETFEESHDHRNDVTTLPAEPDSDDEEEPFYTQPQTMNDDNVSYESPNITFEPIEIDHSCIEQSTPKKDVYLTKCDTRDDNLMEIGYDTVDSPQSSSFQPTTNEHTPIKEEHQRSTSLKNINSLTCVNSSLTKYRSLKDKIRKSLRRSKTYLKNESRRLSNSISNNFDTESSYWDQSNLGLAELCDLEASANDSVHDQLEKAVNICRQAPELECSEEMVEAERLLLFSAIKANSSSDETTQIMHSAVINSLFQIDAIELSIKQDINKDEFFKYYYTGVFSVGRDIKSTQSSESRNNKVYFSNCNIIFENVQQNSEIKCDIYMLRLRKIMNSPTSTTPRDKTFKKNDKTNTSYSNGSSEEVMSRFRLQGSFICSPINFVPFYLNVTSDKSIPDNKFCLLSENQCSVEINKISRTTNLKNEARLLGKLKMHFQQFRLEGFLNYAQINCKYNWNRQWCKLDKLMLFFWNYPQDAQLKQSNFSINLEQCISVNIADRELCSKPRSFIVDYKKEDGIRSVLFSTDSQQELDYWLNGLRDILAFTQKWMKP